MFRRGFLPVFLAIFGLAAHGSADAQNLVLNSGFATDTSNWAASGPGSLSWSSIDASGNPMSGSGVLINNSATPSNGLTLRQCVPMPAGFAYRFSGKVMVPSGANQLLSNTARIDVRFATNSDCTAFPLSAQALPGSNTQFDTWTTFGPMVLTAPPGTVAVLIRGLLTKLPAGGEAIAQYDDFLAEPDTLLLDGFE